MPFDIHAEISLWTVLFSMWIGSIIWTLALQRNSMEGKPFFLPTLRYCFPTDQELLLPKETQHRDS